MPSISDDTLPKFRVAMTGLTHKWGFVIVRTAFLSSDDTTDASQWSAVLSKLRAYVLLSADAGMDPATLALPVISDRALDGASLGTVRAVFNSWVARYQAEGAWDSSIRRDCCLVVDEPALASLLGPPGSEPMPPSPSPTEPWVIALDAADPIMRPYSGGGLYLGWMRVLARATGQLFEDLESQSLGDLCPIRDYDGQVPLYDGTPHGKLVDPPGGSEGRYRFPSGTPRGSRDEKAILAMIRAAVKRGEGTRRNSRPQTPQA
jgi:hypothetical protein